MASLSDVQHRLIRNLIGNVMKTKPTLAINAGSAATIKTTGTNTYTVNGVWLTFAALSAQALTADATQQTILTGQSTFYVQPISTTVFYVVGINAAGTVRTFQGTYAGQVVTPFKFQAGDGLKPDIGDLFTPIGTIKVVTNASTTFTPATTALDAAGLTVTFTDESPLGA